MALLGGYLFLAVASGTMVNIALPYVGTSFGASAGNYGWVVSGFMLMFGVLGSVFGRLGDRYGLRRMYLVGVVVFSVFALLNAAAPDLRSLVFFRMVQGAGAAAMPALGATLVVRLTPPEQRGTLMGILAATIGIAASTGPLLGGALLEVASWRVVFAFPALGLLGVPLLLRVVPSWVDEPQDDGSIDVAGAAMLLLGICGLMLAATLSRDGGLLAPLPLGLLVGGLSLFATLWFWIHRVDRPFLPPSLLRNRPFVGAAALTGLANASRFGTLVLVPILLIQVDGVAPLMVGLVLLPGTLSMGALAPLAGRLADAGYARGLAAWGLVLIAAGCVATAATAGTSAVGVGAGMCLLGVGYSCIQSPMLAVATRALPDAIMGTGNGLFMTSTFLGAALGAFAAVTALDLVSSSAWLPLVGLAGAHSNAILVLALISAPAALLVPLVKREAPGGTDTPRASDLEEG